MVRSAPDGSDKYSLMSISIFSPRTSYRTAIITEMVILTVLVSTLSLTSGLGKVSWQKTCFRAFHSIAEYFKSRSDIFSL